MQRLLARLPDGHPQYKTISTKLYQAKAGYSGELIIDRILGEIAFPPGTKILKDLYVEINPDFLIQIDTLILTPSRAILLEIKNYAGTVQFNEQSGKTIKITPDGEIEKFDCIIHQLDRATNGLERWLGQQQIQLPIEPILVMANQYTEIPEFPTSVALKFAKQLSRHIRGLPALPERFTAQQIAEIATRIHNRQFTWKRKTACKRYNISPADIKKGVLCSDCNIAMPRKQGRTWICEHCEKPGTGALEQAIADWYLLISPTLKNKQLRYFLQLKSNSAASVIFSQLRLKRTGKPPGTIYTWDYKPPLFK